MITPNRNCSFIATIVSFPSVFLPRKAPPLLVHLVIASPAASGAGVSRTRRLATAFLEGLRDSGATFSLAELDVFAQGHSLDLASRGAIAYHASHHRAITDDDKHSIAALDLLLDPLLRADLLVIATPVWNFGVPWRLKQWIDAVAQPGKTFRYSAQGARGLLSCRSVILGALGGPLDDLNALAFTQLRATLSLMGAAPTHEVLAHSLDVDPSKTEDLLVAAERQVASECMAVANEKKIR
jgi:FMN-dependent NADH-azoreductase